MGLPFIKPEIETKLNKLFAGKHYPSMSKDARHQLITDVLKLFDTSVERLFPNLEL
jgi:hypothetical protein